MHLEQCEREGESFLRWTITTDETWAKAYEPKLKRQSNGFPISSAVCPSGTELIRPMMNYACPVWGYAASNTRGGCKLLSNGMRTAQ